MEQAYRLIDEFQLNHLIGDLFDKDSGGLMKETAAMVYDLS